MPGTWRFFWIPKDNVTNIPDAELNKISSSITATTDWYAGMIVLNTDDVQYSIEDTPQGTRYIYTLKGNIPRIAPEIEYLFHQKRNREFILLVEDFNGSTRLVGNTTKGVKFKFETTRSGYTIEYTCTFTEPQPFFSGTITVDSVSIEVSTSTSNQYIRAARWLNGSGAPSNGIGNDFDYYLDNTGNRKYYQKVSGSWVLQGEFIDEELQELAYINSSLFITGNF